MLDIGGEKIEKVEMEKGKLRKKTPGRSAPAAMMQR